MNAFDEKIEELIKKQIEIQHELMELQEINRNPDSLLIFEIVAKAKKVADAYMKDQELTDVVDDLFNAVQKFEEATYE